MGKIYVGQTKLRIQLTVNEDITPAASPVAPLIKYKKPSGSTGSWTATILSATAGSIFYDVTSSADLDEDGLWTIWAYISFSDGRCAAGMPVNVHIYREGQ